VSLRLISRRGQYAGNVFGWRESADAGNRERKKDSSFDGFTPRHYNTPPPLHPQNREYHPALRNVNAKTPFLRAGVHSTHPSPTR
jgi:hypothetical protein